MQYIFRSLKPYQPANREWSLHAIWRLCHLKNASK